MESEPLSLTDCIRNMIDTVRKEQAQTNDPRSLALVITHLEDALLRYEHANR